MPANLFRKRPLRFHPAKTGLRGLGIPAAMILLVAAIHLPVRAQVTSPMQQFGFDIGADYQLVNYRQLVEYWTKLDSESDRLTLQEIGKTPDGRTMIMAVITSPENHARLSRYKEISARLALAKDLTDEEARRLAAEGRAVVWIDGGLHATEILGSQQLLELVWQMVSRDDAETRRFLEDVILLVVPANPDGLDLVADWYMRTAEPEKRSMGGVPVLYQKYIGHDNNRDFNMITQPETEAISRQLFREWYPQIIYNHHQSGPAGTVLFAPPFRDPFNYVFDPLIPVGLDLVSASMHTRFIEEGKPGATMRSGARYSTWWNGGLRTSGYFHNMIGILTETIGSPTPMEIPFVPERILPKQDYPYPIAPQEWHFRQSIDYCVTADKAIIDVASKHREDFLFRQFLMGKHAIEKGSRDTWTLVPHTLEKVQAAIDKDRSSSPNQQPSSLRGGFRRGGASVKYYEAIFDPAERDPRGYILPAGQPDFPTATKFVNALIKSGCEVLRATAEFMVAGKSYPKNSFVIMTAQAFRPHILSLFEPQNHPDDFSYPGGPPIPPYDAAGWTLAYQMGLTFDRILEGFEGPFETVSEVTAPPAGVFESRAGAAGYALNHRVNDTFIAVNRLLKAKTEVYWTKADFRANGRSYPAGTIYVPAKPAAVPILQRAARELGLNIDGVSTVPAVEAYKLKPIRIGLWDQYGGSMNSGWTRWLLEQFEFPYTPVFAPALDAGNLNAKFDVLIFVGGSIPRLPSNGEEERGFRGFQAPAPENVPDEYKDRIGRISAEKTIPILKKFLEAGGAILALDTATALAGHLGLPVANPLVEINPDGTVTPLRSDKLYVPGSILKAKVDTNHPLAHGMPEEVDVFFDNTPCFELLPDAVLKGVRPVAWFGNEKLLRSGWAWGEKYLHRTVQVVEAAVGKGKLFLFGPEITFRGQPHGTFKFLFNAIHYGGAESTKLK